MAIHPYRGRGGQSGIAVARLSITQLFPSAHDSFASFQRAHGYEWKTNGIGSPSLGITLNREFTTQDVPFCIQPIFQGTAFSAAPLNIRAHRPMRFSRPRSAGAGKPTDTTRCPESLRSRPTWATGWRTHAPTAPPPSYFNSSVYRRRVLAGMGTSDFTTLPLIRVSKNHGRSTLPHQFSPANPYISLLLLQHVAMFVGQQVGFFSCLRVLARTSICCDVRWPTGRLLQLPSYTCWQGPRSAE